MLDIAFSVFETATANHAGWWGVGAGRTRIYRRPTRGDRPWATEWHILQGGLPMPRWNQADACTRKHVQDCLGEIHEKDKGPEGGTNFRVFKSNLRWRVQCCDLGRSSGPGMAGLEDLTRWLEKIDCSAMNSFSNSLSVFLNLKTGGWIGPCSNGAPGGVSLKWQHYEHFLV